MRLLFILLLLPLVEIGLFVVTGGWIGVWGVLSLVVLTALFGIIVLRGKLARIQALLRAGIGDPARLLTGGAMTALGALLLILPGFLTDVFGLVLLLPPLQRLLSDRLASGANLRQAHKQSGDMVIEGDYVVEETPAQDRDPAKTDDDRPRSRPGLPRRH